jgi:uncharacterized protein YfdQ (DUF2303 family)
MNNTEADAIKKIADLGVAAEKATLRSVIDPRNGFEVPFIAVGERIVGLKPILDPWLGAPERCLGVAMAQTLEAFIDLTNRHKSDDSAVFASTVPEAPSLTTVIDYHTLGHEPQFGEHRVHFPFPISSEWKAWNEQNGEEMSQGELCAFIEDNIADLSAPEDGESRAYGSMFQTTVATPAEIILLSRGLQVRVNTEVKETRVIQSGEAEITFSEAHNDASGAKLKVPGLFVVAIPMFNGDPEKTRIVARLRYRVSNGRVRWMYQLWRPDLAVIARVRAAIVEVGEKTQLPTFEAKPEMG